MFLKRKLAINFALICFCFVTFILGITFIPRSAHAATAEELVSRYASSLKTGKKVNILIVPGHDEQYWGTEFNDIHEADVTVAIAQFLFADLKKDPKLNVTITRTQTGYTDTFKNYFVDHRQDILDFIASSTGSFKQQVSSGSMSQNEVVPHANAKPEVVLRLYGINKWASENNIDLVVHIHVNDGGGRLAGEVGPYKGFTVYIPDQEYSNSSTSIPFGKAIHDSLAKKYPTSTYPPEQGGFIQDQQLIAIGAANTLKSAAALVEYGYIYEPQFLNVDTQDLVTKAYADQTYAGIESFFGKKVAPTSSFTMLSPTQVSKYLPYTWSKNFQKGTGSKADVSALQAALTNTGFYNCGVTGTFGPCTETAVKTFQSIYFLDQTGTVGTETRNILNTLFSR